MSEQTEIVSAWQTDKWEGGKQKLPMMLGQALMEENKKKEYRKMRRIYWVNDERTHMAKIRYLLMKDYTQMLFCRTLHGQEDGSKKMMFNHITRLMRKQEHLKALEVEEVDQLRGLKNGILNGAYIPKKWKESRVELLHNGGRTDELKNYQPIKRLRFWCTP